jgi:hypothetical protein
MNLINKERAKQLENRILKLRLNHDKEHERCFKTERVYAKSNRKRLDYIKAEEAKGRDYYDITKDKACPPSWEETKEHNYLQKSRRILLKLQNELLAILYYNAVRNNGYTFNMISKVKDINKYNQAGFGYDAIDLSPLSPKTEEEIAEKEAWDNATFLEKLDMKTLDYSVGNKKANEACHKLVKDICKLIFSDKRLPKALLTQLVEEGIEKIVPLSSIVQDKESVRAIESTINKALKEADYAYQIDTY